MPSPLEMAAGVERRTGRPLSEWLAIVPEAPFGEQVGLRLEDHTTTARLVAAGSFGSGNITHRVALSAPEDVDAELRTAYDGAAAR